MSLSTTVVEWVAAYEQKRNRKPPEASVKVARHIDKVGEMLREQGKKDAQNGEKPYPSGTFVEMAKYIFHNDPDEETARVIGKLWHSEYLEGYEEGGAV